MSVLAPTIGDVVPLPVDVEGRVHLSRGRDHRVTSCRVTGLIVNHPPHVILFQRCDRPCGIDRASPGDPLPRVSNKRTGGTR